FKQPPKVTITIKTRSDKPKNYIPSRLYSSLKYEIFQTITIPSTLIDSTSILMGNIQVIDLNNEEILKDKKPIINGQCQVVLTREVGNYNHCKMKIQFTDVSYHHPTKYFCLRCCYYIPSNLNEPILIMKSAPFKVYARRPTSPKKQRIQKRKKNISLNTYLSCLDELIKMKDKLNEDNRRKAMDLAFKKLIKLDHNLIQRFSSRYSIKL